MSDFKQAVRALGKSPAFSIVAVATIAVGIAANTALFAPRVFEVAGLTPQQVENSAGYSQPIARLKVSVSLQQAAAELSAIGRASKEQFPTRLDANNASIPVPFVSSLVSNLEPTFYTLIGAVGFVLLIACANVASLFLGRLTARQKEIAVRQAIGATRPRVVRQFMIESLVFSLVAGGLGLLLALWALSAIQSIVAAQLPPNTILTLNWRALAFTGGVTLATALLVGLAPALQASRSHIVEALKDSARGSSGERGRRFHATLIVAEVALSVVLLVGSSLLLVSFLQLQRTHPGFEPRVPQARSSACQTADTRRTRSRRSSSRRSSSSCVLSRASLTPRSPSDLPSASRARLARPG